MHFLKRLAVLPVYAAILLISLPAVASDGVIEINSVRAEMGGITPGDAPGYPVTISESGSYRLTNMLLISAFQAGISVEANNVTIDLNGFGIRGPVTCTPETAECSESVKSDAKGIIGASDTSFLTIKNGSVTGTGNTGINCSFVLGCVIENVVVSHANVHGIYTGIYSRVSNCTVHSNRTNGINARTGSIVSNNTIYQNGRDGVEVSGSGGVILTSNVLSKNGATEIDMSNKITAIGGNTLDPKVEGNWFDNYSGAMVEISTNYCIDSSPPPHTNCTGL